jgi:pantoate--beta-alanine ligase
MNLQIIRSRDGLREALSSARRDGSSIGLVPTMGALHEGHLSLIRAARAANDLVVVSVFVNPTQFGPSEDFEAYPRDEARDAALAAEAGTDILYAPPVAEVYPDGFATTVEVSGLTEVLCGDPASRGPEHFRGVTTIVAKLFNTVQPDVAYFGRKDAQQALVIERMARDLDFPVRVEVLPTVREEDGLAMSSRNRYLTDDDRRRAGAIPRALAAAREAADRGEPLDSALDAARAELRGADIEPEYLEARDAEDLSPVAELNGHPILLAVAARVGKARLIDNLTIEPTTQKGA